MHIYIYTYNLREMIYFLVRYWNHKEKHKTNAYSRNKIRFKLLPILYTICLFIFNGVF